MKTIVIGVLTLLMFNLNAQKMKNPNEVVTQLFVATDQGAWNDVKATFNSKVLLDYSSMTGNPSTELTPDQIITAWQGILPGFDATHHQLGNFLTKLDGDKANVFCYGTATHYLVDDNGNLWTVVGSYDFELVKDAKENWKISVMRFNFKYQDGNLELPQKAIAKLK